MASTGINNSSGSETFEDFGTAWKAYARQQEGIIEGLVVTPTSPESQSVKISAGSISIKMDGNKYSTYTFDETTSLAISNTTSNTYTLVQVRCRQIGASQLIGQTAGTTGASTDPDLSEGGIFLDYYVPIARIVGNGGNITGADIIQDGVTLTNNATPERIGYRFLDARWTPFTETVTYSSVDDPTGVVTINGDLSQVFTIGTKIRFDNNSNTIYGKVSKVAVASNITTLTFLHEIDPGNNVAVDVITDNPITSFYFAGVQTMPTDFPKNEASWTLEALNVTDQNQTNPVNGTWYNLGSNSLAVHTGDWNIGYTAVIRGANATAVDIWVRSTLSKASNTEDNALFSAGARANDTKSEQDTVCVQVRAQSLTAKTTYYLNVASESSSISNLQIRGGADATTRIAAVFAY